MKRKMSFSAARDKAKQLGYKFTQEGQSIHLETPKIKTTFPRKDQFALWMFYHVTLDLSGDYDAPPIHD